MMRRTVVVVLSQVLERASGVVGVDPVEGARLWEAYRAFETDMLEVTYCSVV